MLSPSHSPKPGIRSKPDSPGSQAGGAELFRKVFKRLGLAGPVPSFQVDFYPFTGVRHSIHLNDNRVRVRMSDVLQGAPPLVLEALAEILISRVYGRTNSREAQDYYRSFISTPRVERQVERLKRERGRKKMAPPRGQVYNLQTVFCRLNRRYFSGRLRGVKIGWSLRKSRSVLGHFDPAHRAIVISRALDHPRTPRFVLEFLIYHEMLHLKFPPLRRARRRVFHSREFRQAEKRFPRSTEARKELHLVC